MRREGGAVGWMREKFNNILIGLLVQRDGENDERVWISKLDRFICYLCTLKVTF
jgi:hypothetical protein